MMRRSDSPTGRLSGLVGICCNVLLFALKLFAGLATGAVSIMADAFNTLSDAAASVVTLIGFLYGGKTGGFGPSLRPWAD